MKNISGGNYQNLIIENPYIGEFKKYFSTSKHPNLILASPIQVYWVRKYLRKLRQRLEAKDLKDRKWKKYEN